MHFETIFRPIPLNFEPLLPLHFEDDWIFLTFPLFLVYRTWISKNLGWFWLILSRVKIYDDIQVWFPGPTWKLSCANSGVAHPSLRAPWLKWTMETLKLNLCRKFFDWHAALSVKGCIRYIVFKWVKNTNSNSPWGWCLTQALTSEQILKICKFKL